MKYIIASVLREFCCFKINFGIYQKNKSFDSFNAYQKIIFSFNLK